MNRNWESIKSGYVIQMGDGRFVENIIANGGPENPWWQKPIYFSKYVFDAKVWKTARGAMTALKRVREKTGEDCYVRDFEYDEDKRARVLLRTLEPLDM